MTAKTSSASASADIDAMGVQARQLWDQAVAWLRTDSLEALIAVGAAVLLFLLFEAIKQFVTRGDRKGEAADVQHWRGIAVSLVARTNGFFLAAAAAVIVANYVAPPGALLRTINFLFTIAAVIQGAIWVREIILALIGRRAATADDDQSTLASAMGVIRLLVNVAVWAVAIILILDNLGVNVTALVAGLGIGGIAIGLAAQGIFSDLFAALSILFDKPFKKGDAISFGATSGTVEAIGLKTTRIRALSGEQIVVSNTNLLSQQLHNNRRIEERRVVMNLGLIYQTDPAVLERIPEELRKIVEARSRCRFDRAHFSNFGPSSLDFELVFFVTESDYAIFMDEKQAVSFAILRRFTELDVDFAYPSQTSYLAGPDGRIVDPAPASAQPMPPEMR